jgi:type IV pilus assembly protein PilV
MRTRDGQYQTASAAKHQRGVALLEVMITFFVLAVGLLGLAALQVKSMQFNQDSYLRSQATVAAYDILDRMRLSPGQVSGGTYNIAFGTTSWAQADPAGADLTAWVQFLNATLPNGDGSINCTGASVCTVTIQWTDRLHDTAGTLETFATTSKL